MMDFTGETMKENWSETAIEMWNRGYNAEMFFFYQYVWFSPLSMTFYVLGSQTLQECSVQVKKLKEDIGKK